MITHCPKDDLLVSYSAGALGESWSLAVGSHVHLCKEFSDDVALGEKIGGSLLSDLAPIALEKSLDALLDRLGDQEPIGEAVNQEQDALIPSPLCDYIGDSLDDLEWSMVGNGITQHLIETSDSGQARLLRIPSGTALPEHEHSGRELTLVISGGYKDDSGSYSRGDMADIDDGLGHQPIADEGEDCVCLIVTDTPIKFKGILPRILQPFIKI
jgi:putative transcriptional regulator